MPFSSKQEIVATLEQKLGPLDGKNPMAFLNRFGAQASTAKGVPFSKVIDSIMNLLKNEEKIVAFSEGNIGWATKGDDLLSFENPEKFAQFLTMEVLYGAESYYLFPENLAWMAAICFDEDLHVAGPKEFIEKVKGLII
jgi:hypothetical protein